MRIDPDRRRFLAIAGASVLAFLAAGCSPSRAKSRGARAALDGGAFGGRIDAGPIDRIRRSWSETGEPWYVPAARSYVVPFPATSVNDAKGVYPKDALPMLDAGVIALYQRCTHLGCRVPWCKTSAWFECPCHDAKFDQIGQHRRGPARRGLDIVPSSIEAGHLVLDTGAIVHGVPNGTRVGAFDPTGPFCV